jgi:hypothetical protein
MSNVKAIFLHVAIGSLGALGGSIQVPLGGKGF